MFLEMMAQLKKLNDLEKVQLKHIAFDNVMMNAVPDQRKFIRDIKKLIRDDSYTEYFAEQQSLEQQLYEQYLAEEIHSKQDIDSFAQKNYAIAEKLKNSMERALQKSRAQQIKAKPIENMRKCVDLLTDVDTRLFATMGPEDRENVQSELQD